MSSRFWMIQGSKKHRRWMKKSISVRYATMVKGCRQFSKKQQGWLHVVDPDDGYIYAHHLMDFKPLLHKGRKP